VGVPVTEDIVTRLLGFTPLADVDLVRLMLDAANEIERLRAELSDFKTEYQRLEMKQIRAERRWR
jgi:hypothetical protein